MRQNGTRHGSVRDRDLTFEAVNIPIQDAG
jgi:hypothetical protein